MTEDAVVATAADDRSATRLSFDEEALLRRLVDQARAVRHGLTIRHCIVSGVLAILAAVIVPALVFFHYVWQYGFPIALFPLVLAAIFLIGALVFAFNASFQLQADKLQNLVPLFVITMGILVGVGLVQFSTGIHFLAKTSGVINWTGESLTQVGGVVAKARHLTSEIKGATGDLKGAVQDARETVVTTNETVREISKLAESGTSAARATRGLMDEIRVTYDFVRAWWSSTPNQSISNTKSPAATEVALNPARSPITTDQPTEQGSNANSEGQAQPVQSSNRPGVFTRFWTWLRNLW